LKKAQLELCLPEKSGREGSFGLACCLDRAAGTGKKELTRRGNVDIGGRATVEVGTGLVMSCCNWVVRPIRVVLMVCSEAF